MMVGDHFRKHLVHRTDLGQRVDVGAIDDMHQQIGVDDLFQRRAKRLDQLRRQMPHETHGVADHERASVVELSTASGGFQGRKQRVLHQNAGAGQRVEQAGLAGVGVADDRNRR